MKIVEESYDIVICGGGMAGFCAAIASARQGKSTCLIHDRPVLGGNASSEIRVTIHGAACHHHYARETGIIMEAMNAERRSNHLYPTENGWTNSVHDMALYDMTVREPLLTLHLNTTLMDAQLSDGTWGLDGMGRWPVAHDESGYYHRPACHNGLTLSAIRTVTGQAEVTRVIRGQLFIDCTGDGLLAHLAGCEWRMGSESRHETGEIHAPEKASKDTMGNSIHIRCIDTGRPSPFTPPAWAIHYDDADFFYKGGRIPNEPEGGDWWIEIGGPWHTIYDNEVIRHELTRHALGVWDWMKNKDPKTMEKCKNYALEFIGQVPGKRESRRIMGLHFLNENELQRRENFHDECAYGGWFIDLHTPGGLLAEHSEPASAAGYDHQRKELALKLIGPYGIPARSLISKDVPNLMMAGRNISVTHAALGTVRVMATCGLMGQAVGTLAVKSLDFNKPLCEMTETKGFGSVQQQLLKDGCLLPHHQNKDENDLALKAQISCSSEKLFSGTGVDDLFDDLNIREWIVAWKDSRVMTTAKTPCLWLYLAGGKLDTLSLALWNKQSTSSNALITLRKVNSLWDYAHEESEPLWSQEISVPSDFDEMLDLSLGLQGLQAGCYRIEVKGPEELFWRVSRNHPYGVSGGILLGHGKFHWNRLHGEYAFKLSPAQPIFSAREVLTGITRPSQSTNVWLSDPNTPFPHWVDLTWEHDVEVSKIHLTFPAQLVLETHWENPFYVAPHIAKSYRIQTPSSNGWKTLLHIQNNVSYRVEHLLERPERLRHLRILIESTHGRRESGLAEIRCYA